MSRNSAGPLCLSWPASRIYPTNRPMTRCRRRSRPGRSHFWLWAPLPGVSRRDALIVHLTGQPGITLWQPSRRKPTRKRKNLGTLAQRCRGGRARIFRRAAKPAKPQPKFFSKKQEDDREWYRAAKPQPNVAKRLECVELAPALGRGGWPESASKLDALHTLREVRQRSGRAGPNSY